MITPEKSDIDITKLFHWSGELILVDRFDKVVMNGYEPFKCYIRLVGDADINRARVFAIRKSQKMRKALKDPESDERMVFIDEIYSGAEKEAIVESCGMLKLREFSQLAYKDVQLPFPKEPKSDATLEEQENYQSLVDSYEGRYNQAINEYIFKLLVQYKEQLATRPMEAVQKEYEKLVIDSICEKEMINRFREYCTYAGSFLDPEFTKPAFKSFEEFDNLPSEIKEQYLAFYESLEMPVDTLKK